MSVSERERDRKRERERERRERERVLAPGFATVKLTVKEPEEVASAAVVAVCHR